MQIQSISVDNYWELLLSYEIVRVAQIWEQLGVAFWSAATPALMMWLRHQSRQSRKWCVAWCNTNICSVYWGFVLSWCFLLYYRARQKNQMIHGGGFGFTSAFFQSYTACVSSSRDKPDFVQPCASVNQSWGASERGSVWNQRVVTVLATGRETEMSVCWRRGVGVIIWIWSYIISAALNPSVHLC